MITHKRSSTAL